MEEHERGERRLTGGNVEARAERGRPGAGGHLDGHVRSLGSRRGGEHETESGRDDVMYITM